MYFKVCSRCGAHLDPGELCDCRETEKEAAPAAPSAARSAKPSTKTDTAHTSDATCVWKPRTHGKLKTASLKGAKMPKFYFTYGTDGQPFVGGWTEVDAPDGHAACAAFRAYHPDKTEGLLNCSSVYDEAHFKLTEMYRRDNFGFRCHELIQITRTGVPR